MPHSGHEEAGECRSVLEPVVVRYAGGEQMSSFFRGDAAGLAQGCETLAAGNAGGEADQDRGQGGEARLLPGFSDGRGDHSEAAVCVHPGAHARASSAGAGAGMTDATVGITGSVRD